MVPTGVLPRCSVVVSLLLSCLAASLAAAADRVPLVVMTSYGDNVVSRIEEAFETAHPDIDMQVLWRRSDDALATLMSADGDPVDVYWSPAPRTFRALAEAGRLTRMTVDHAVLPGRIGAYPISDPEDRYLATEIAGYGIVYDPRALARLGVPEPRDYDDLADPRLAGQVVVPIPSQVGYAPAWLDMMLQHYGWAEGWRHVARIAGQARLGDMNAAFIAETIGEGDALAGVTMDFFASSSIDGGMDTVFRPGRSTGYMPASVGILTSAPHAEVARTFVAYLLSPGGQRLLFHPDIRRLPVRPDVWKTDAPAGSINPFTAPLDGPVYDVDLGLDRRAGVSAVFDAFLTDPHDRAQRAWAALQGAAHAEQVAALLTQVPVSQAEAEASAPLFQKVEDETATDEEYTQAEALRTAWRQQALESLAAAEALLEENAR